MSKENKETSPNRDISQMSDAHLLSDTGTLLEYHSDKKRAIVQVDDTNNRFLYDEVTLISQVLQVSIKLIPQWLVRKSNFLISIVHQRISRH